MKAVVSFLAKEYIERGAAQNAIFEYICGHTMSKFPSRELLDASKKGAEGAMYSLDDVPAADVVEVVHGEWIDTGDEELDKIYSGYKCSVCGFIICGHSGKYCSDCGAKMDGERKEKE